jgi:integrase
MRTLVLPAFEHLTLREIGVARCDHFLKQLAKQSYNRAKQARVVLRLALGLAVRHEVLPRNPMDSVSRLHRPPHAPSALTPVEVNAIRMAIAFWEGGRGIPGPKPDGQLGVIVEVMLGTSARIGEVLAIRRRDVDITGAPPSIRIAGTIITRKGRGDNAARSPEDREVPEDRCDPTFTAEAVRKRLTRFNTSSPDALLFTSWCRTRSRTARPYRSEDHHPALHPPQRDGEPCYGRAARSSTRQGGGHLMSSLVIGNHHRYALSVTDSVGNGGDDGPRDAARSAGLRRPGLAGPYPAWP